MIIPLTTVDKYFSIITDEIQIGTKISQDLAAIKFCDLSAQTSKLINKNYQEIIACSNFCFLFQNRLL